MDHSENIKKEIIFSSKNEQKSIPIFPLNNIKGQVAFDVLFFNHVHDYGTLVSSAHRLQKVGFVSYYNFMPIPYNAGITTTHIPDYFKSNRQDLEHVFDLLQDEESKRILAARIRALETGNIGYIELSEFPEYFHPKVCPEKGDVILDGGISESIGSQVLISKTIGEEGKLYGFEPDPVGLCKANDNLKKQCPYDNYKLVPLGIWHKKDTLYFKLAGVGTHVVKEQNEDSVACNVISIDEFVEASFIKKVDFIKLDIEGAESNALKGAIKTITRFKPKMAISLYHKPQDLYYLPRLLLEICNDYELYMGHHHASLHETVLYAKVKGS